MMLNVREPIVRTQPLLMSRLFKLGHQPQKGKFFVPLPVPAQVLAVFPQWLVQSRLEVNV